jgi:site-specific DNA recombinase
MRNKKVVGYARISNDEQSHFSISGQIEQIEMYCEKNGFDLVKTFVDEGQSAKDFNRKSWKELERFLTLNYKEIDYLVVFKYDRFSRNVMESLNVIHQLEENYKIKLVSISEPIGLPPESPFYFQLRTTMLLNAHSERLVIRDRTIFGQRKARNGGRYLGIAPYGYKNERDNEKKPIITIDEVKANIVRKIFDMYLENYSIAEIERKSKEIGFTKTGKDRIQTLLKNTIYVGLIRVKAHLDEPEKYVPGIHVPIIDKDTFYRVQAKISKPTTPIRRYNDEAYLKSAIVCPECYLPYTICRSKGRSKHYWYYECRNHRKSLNADKAHDIFDNILKELDFSDQQISYLEQSVKLKLQKHLEENQIRIPSLLKEKQALVQKKEKLEEKYLSGKFSDSSFLNWNQKLAEEINILNTQIRTCQSKESDYWNTYFARLSNLKNISDVFHSADAQLKQNFIEKGFGKQLSYDGNIYRTAFLSPLFVSKALILKNKGLLEYNKKRGIFTNPPLRVLNEAPTEPIISILDWLDAASA